MVHRGHQCCSPKDQVCLCSVAQSCLTRFHPSQVPLCVGFPRQEYWSGLPFPTPGDFPNTEIEPHVSCTGKQTVYHSATWDSRVTYQESTQTETLKNRPETAVPTGTGAEEMEKGRGNSGGCCDDARSSGVAGGKEVKVQGGREPGSSSLCGEDPLEPPQHGRTSKLGNAQGPSGQRPGDFSYNSLAKAETRKAR